MPPATLGLTCKDALMIFSQNETLRLQEQVAQLESELARYNPPKRVFESHDQYEAARLKADDFLSDWIENNIHGCHSEEYDRKGWQYSICDVWELDKAVARYLQIMTLDVESSNYHADKLLYHVNTALNAARNVSDMSGEIEWCRDSWKLRLIVLQALDDAITIFLMKVVDWKCDDDQ